MRVVENLYRKEFALINDIDFETKEAYLIMRHFRQPPAIMQKRWGWTILFLKAKRMLLGDYKSQN